MYLGRDLDPSKSRDHSTSSICAQVRVETTHDVSGPPSTPHVRVDDDDDDEEECAQVVDAEADDEHIHDAATMFGDPQQRNQDPASSNYSLVNIDNLYFTRNGSISEGKDIVQYYTALTIVPGS